jgi:hypothetical protein
MILLMTIFIVFILLYCIYYHYTPYIYLETTIESMTPAALVPEDDIINPNANLVDSLYLNEYNDKISSLITKFTNIRNDLNNIKKPDFIQLNCEYKTPPKNQRIGIQDNSQSFTVTTESNGVLTHTVNIEVPVGVKGPPGPQGDEGEEGVTGSQGETGETGNCGSILYQ